MKQLTGRIALLTAFSLLLSGCAGIGGSKPKEGDFPLSVYRENFTGTGTIDKKGGLLDATARTSALEWSLTEPYSLNGRGQFSFVLTNTSDVKELTVQFITAEDPAYTNFKRFVVPIAPTDKKQRFTVDLSDTYGWLGHLTGLRVTAGGITHGAIRLYSFSVEEGGEHYLPYLQIADPEVYLPARQRIMKHILVGPDGIVGSWFDRQNQQKFISCANGKPFVCTGTPDSPFESVDYTDGIIDGVDWSVYGYCSIAQVLRNPTTGTLIGISHLERHYNENNTYSYTATLGLCVSRDDGKSWTLLGECISHNIPVGEHIEISRDIGNGAILTDDEYLYIYYVEMAATDYAYGMGVARINLDELYAATEKNELPEAWKYKDGNWNEPGWQGAADNLLPQDVVPNFMCLSYNTVLKKYLMVMCQSPYYTSNDGDILLMVSDDMLDWRQASRQWLATGRNGEQYPVIIGTGLDGQTVTGDEFYVYWCSWYAFDENGNSDWQLLWGSADYIRQKITIVG